MLDLTFKSFLYINMYNIMLYICYMNVKNELI